MDFTELFRPVSPEKFAENFNIFNLTGADFYLVSAGTNHNYNTMIGSGGGFGFFLKIQLIGLFSDKTATLLN